MINIKVISLAKLNIIVSAIVRNKNWIVLLLFFYFLSAFIFLKNHADEYSVTAEISISRVYTPDISGFDAKKSKVLNSSFFDRTIEEINSKALPYCSDKSGYRPGTLQIFDVIGKGTLGLKYKTISSNAQDMCMRELIDYISTENSNNLKIFKSKLISRFASNKINKGFVDRLVGQYKRVATHNPQAALVFLQSEAYRVQLQSDHNELLKAIDIQPSPFNVLEGPTIKILPYKSSPFLLLAIFVICFVIPLLALHRFDVLD